MRAKRKATKARAGEGWRAKFYPSYNRIVGEVRRDGKVVKRIYGAPGVDSPAEKQVVEAQLKRYVDLPEKTDATATVQAAMEAFASRDETDTKPIAASTRDRYKRIMKLLSGLAPLRLIDVQPDDIEKALKGIKGDPKRGATMARTRQIAYMFLHGVFRKAVKKRVITFNPCDGVDAPKWHREEEPTIFTRDEQHFLKQAARGTPYEALLLLGLSVPMRVGELLGIARENVNLSRREIAIRQNLGETAEGGYVPTLGPLKTFESRRDVPMSDEVLSAFTRLLEARLAAGRTTPETLVFLSPEGHPVRYSHLFRRWFRPLLQAAAAEAEKAARAAGDRHYRFPVGASLYDLRHTAFTNMVEDGVAQGTFHALAGHANALTSLKHYNKPSRKSLHDAVNVRREPVAGAS